MPGQVRQGEEGSPPKQHSVTTVWAGPATPVRSERFTEIGRCSALTKTLPPSRPSGGLRVGSQRPDSRCITYRRELGLDDVDLFSQVLSAVGGPARSTLGTGSTSCEPPRCVRRLHLLGRVESCRVRRSTRRSCVSGLCGCSPRSVVSMPRSGRRSATDPPQRSWLRGWPAVSAAPPACGQVRTLPAQGLVHPGTAVGVIRNGVDVHDLGSSSSAHWRSGGWAADLTSRRTSTAPHRSPGEWDRPRSGRSCSTSFMTVAGSVDLDAKKHSLP